jgi:site-specific DNA recombinase
MPERSKHIRCAIYTRKSSEEGLEQNFNSLDAQREACSAYIQSQRHEGWREVTTAYEDGGYSGGNLERPGLQELLTDIKARKVDLIVVYKIDRLTRSLTDFASLVGVFDAHQTSFVSVTQSFNTTTSMGRLTLNVLLSFAQFEREITGERIRDKIQASKRKGMWMGGTVPLGYNSVDKKLIVVPDEATQVRRIFALYRESGSVQKLQEKLFKSSEVSKVRITRSGKPRGGKPFSRGALYLILKNQVYRGQIHPRHRADAACIEGMSPFLRRPRPLRPKLANQKHLRPRTTGHHRKITFRQSRGAERSVAFLGSRRVTAFYTTSAMTGQRGGADRCQKADAHSN